MPTAIIDGRELPLPEGERLNGIEAARRAGVEIPHYCWHPGLSVVGSCRMCLVEIGTRDAKTGKITMQPKLMPACNTIVGDGTVLVTNSEKVALARARVEEGLLLRHPIDCPICDKAGECRLQDYHFQHGQDQRRADIRPFTSRRRDIGDITLFVDRCIMCSRCVRFVNEISGTGELMVVNRGAHEEIDVAPGYPLHNKLSGNVVDLCPVGALADKDFLYRQRVWFLRRHKSVCTRCASGCSIWIEENQDHIYRVRPRENMQVNRWWICNDGRYGYSYVHDPRRLTSPTRRAEGGRTPIDWAEVVAEIPGRFRAARRPAGVISPFLTVQEAFLLCRLLHKWHAQVVLAVGPGPLPAPGSEADETFPGGFVISAEKCPNRRGVEAIVSHFAGGLIGWGELLDRAGRGEFDAVWVSAGSPLPWISDEQAGRFSGVEHLVVQDLFPSPLSELAAFELPGAAWAEREGAYVNRRHWLQKAAWAIRPPAGVRTEGSLFWELLGREGLYRAETVLEEAATEIACFSPARGPIPEEGVQLTPPLIEEPIAPPPRRDSTPAQP